MHSVREIGRTYAQANVDQFSGLKLDYSESLRRAASELGRTYSPEQFSGISKQLAESIKADRFPGISEQLAQSIKADRLRGISEQLSRTYAPVAMQGLTSRLAESMSIARLQNLPSAADLQLAFSRFEQDMASVEADDADALRLTLGRWLASRAAIAQLELLIAGLFVLAAFSQLVEDASGEDIPDSLQSSIALCFTVVAFLLLLMREREGTED
jgi:hypothetical protein